jgi:hypothetical protein
LAEHRPVGWRLVTLRRLRSAVFRPVASFRFLSRVAYMAARMAVH